MAVTARQLVQTREQCRPASRGGGKEQPQKLPGGAGQEAGIRRRTVLWVQVLTALVVIFVLALGLIVTETAIANRGYELAGLRAQLREAQMHSDLLEAEVASLRSTQRIVGVAEEQLGLVQVGSPAAVASISENSPVTRSGGQGAVTTASADDSSAGTGRRVVLYLESEPTVDGGLRLADMGTWLLRWLRGTTPVRAGN